MSGYFLRKHGRGLLNDDALAPVLVLYTVITMAIFGLLITGLQAG